MEKLNLGDWPEILRNLENIFSLGDSFDFMDRESIGILVVLDYIKAKEWPRWGQPLVNDPLIEFPLVWATFTVGEEDHVTMCYDIHPAKCYPLLYAKYNPNSAISPAPIENGWGGTLAGCSRSPVRISNRPFRVTDKTPEYCSIFGIPDDCYDPGFEKRMIGFLEQHKEVEFWCYEETDYIRDKVSPVIDLHSMREEILPSRHFIHTEASEDFLRGLFRANDLKPLNKELWYSHGKEFIEEMNLNDSDFCFRFEKEALYYIRKRLVHEFVRLLLLLTNRERLSAFAATGPPELSRSKEDEARQQLVFCYAK